MPLFSIILGAYSGDVAKIRYALNGLRQQTVGSFEVIVTLKGCTQLDLPERMLHQPMAFLECLDNDFHGNPERHRGLQEACGKFVTWLSADNIVYPQWLENHLANFAQAADVTSVVNTDYWLPKEGYKGVLPISLTPGGIDLLNFALPIEMARDVDAFGERDRNETCSDWKVFARCQYPAVTWVQNQPPCAAHF